jgi:hypothetical protein
MGSLRITGLSQFGFAIVLAFAFASAVRAQNPPEEACPFSEETLGSGGLSTGDFLETLRDRAIELLILGETHKEERLREAAYAFAREWIASEKEVDCLLLEIPQELLLAMKRAKLSPAFKERLIRKFRFSTQSTAKGLSGPFPAPSYEESLIHMAEAFGNYMEIPLKLARELDLKIHGIDTWPNGIEEGKEDYGVMYGVRNPLMASKIAELYRRNECRKAIAVIGVNHLTFEVGSERISSVQRQLRYSSPSLRAAAGIVDARYSTVSYAWRGCRPGKLLDAAIPQSPAVVATGDSGRSLFLQRGIEHTLGGRKKKYDDVPLSLVDFVLFYGSLEVKVEKEPGVVIEQRPRRAVPLLKPL